MNMSRSDSALVFLSQMSVGQKGEILKLIGEGEICHRLLEMGLTTGATIEVVRFAPLGDPIDIKIRGYHLSLRRHEAEAIFVNINKDERETKDNLRRMKDERR